MTIPGDMSWIVSRGSDTFSTGKAGGGGGATREVAEAAGAGGFCGIQEAMLFRLDAGLLFWPPFLLFLGNRRSKMFCRMLQNVNGTL